MRCVVRGGHKGGKGMGALRIHHEWLGHCQKKLAAEHLACKIYSQSLGEDIFAIGHHSCRSTTAERIDEKAVV